MVGLHLHTHSFDRALDHRDLYPFYALAAERDLPIVVQAGASGGRMPSECGHPIGIDRPALYFGETPFVLSHTGWPWTDEAIAMAGKHKNVFLGTAGYPPHHWPEVLVNFLFGPDDPLCFQTMDVNDDDLLTIVDPIYGLNSLFLNGPAIPAPLSECAFDPTPGPLECDNVVCP